MTREEHVKKEIAYMATTDLTFRYQLLSRMQSDCEYFLGNGARLEKYLWGQDVKSHIEYMLALWDMFPQDAKPEWLTREQIEDYSRRMAA